MDRRNKVASIAFTGAAATLTVGLTAAQAQATSSWHIKNAGVGFHGAIKGKNKTGTKATLKDTTTGALLTCNTVTGSGSVPVSHVPAIGSPTVAKVSKMNFTNCTIGGTIPFTAKLNKAANLHAKSYNGTTGVTHGFLGGSAGALSGTLTGVGNNCKATITGSKLPGSGHNTGHSIVVNPGHSVTLTVKSAKSCGLLHANDKAWISGNVVITTPSALTIQKP